MNELTLCLNIFAVVITNTNLCHVKMFILIIMLMSIIVYEGIICSLYLLVDNNHMLILIE